ncbi:TPA: 4'-phosphopantetheinyl transferase superfamily protein [Streptococcus equi subsp. equi]|uniref:4'-phosphopantetheinyl transferase family protein n=1 Tax=Streptococcus equi TaxID=1336 RepID=UPI00065A51A5|nr:4'-phosphopantetheinyl transferase superfamily protein [Streptococcus equi]MCD3539184.1 4'-phosphopantetheinyl transferase superfamily protein [Streptococcus equi subsp. equi]MCD3560755.1 4'-phosphopantetheinyl transferase superfamily protein [Streptococcus equi subsp. equi]MCD3562008.1 4'-phosphopantetheinyl transferase superfamily protein [Streptococcus equi subsp. equi]NBK65725.1 4'-phosphopantetheinyl transferase superfamily protein [Streptococcus equi]NBL32809.1 4'-phosphopantetheinyl 
MKIYKIEISDKKELRSLIDISRLLIFFDMVLVTSNTSEFMIKDLKNFLKEEEIEKLDAYKSEVAKINFAVSRSLLNKVFEMILGVPIENIVSFRDKHNKPYIENKSGVKFNISHTDGFVVIGFSKKELGIDIEKVNDGFAFEDILENCFTSREIKNIGSNIPMFYRYWTAKEAYLKYEGYGLIRNPKEIEVIYIDNQRIKIEDKVKRSNKDLIAFSISSKYFGAICI